MEEAHDSMHMRRKKLLINVVIYRSQNSISICEACLFCFFFFSLFPNLMQSTEHLAVLLNSKLH